MKRHLTISLLILSLGILMCCWLSACKSTKSTQKNPLYTPSYQRVGAIEGFDLPETVVHDTINDHYLVSNIVGNPSRKANNGFISLIRAKDFSSIQKFIAGGKNGVVLHAPKGMCIRNDTLWVLDIDALRSFDLIEGKMHEVINLKPHGALSLNDITLHTDGSFYITDPKLVFDDSGKSKHKGTDCIYKVSPNGEVKMVVETDQLARPNGIEWDAKNQQIIVVPLENNKIYAWKEGSEYPHLLGESVGKFDGVELWKDGSILVSSLRDGSIYEFKNGLVNVLLTGFHYPGNFGTDKKRHRLLIPLILNNKVEIWEEIQPDRA